MQMDADDDEPLNRGILAGSEQTQTDPTKPDQEQTGSHPTEPDDTNQQQQQPDGPIATATDLALEQDA